MFDAYTGEELVEDDLYEMFDEHLDGIYGPVEIACVTFDASRILKDIDYIAYNEAYLDWLSSELEDGYRFTEEAPVEEDDDDD